MTEPTSELVKRLDELISEQRGVDKETMVCVRQRLGNLMSEVERLTTENRVFAKVARADTLLIESLQKCADRRVAEEREACAALVEELHSSDYFFVADAIRSRSNGAEPIKDNGVHPDDKFWGSDRVTAHSTAVSPISQDGSIDRKSGLSEGGQ